MIENLDVEIGTDPEILEKVGGVPQKSEAILRKPLSAAPRAPRPGVMDALPAGMLPSAMPEAPAQPPATIRAPGTSPASSIIPTELDTTPPTEVSVYEQRTYRPPEPVSVGEARPGSPGQTVGPRPSTGRQASVNFTLSITHQVQGRQATPILVINDQAGYPGSLPAAALGIRIETGRRFRVTIEETEDSAPKPLLLPGGMHV